MRLGGKVSQNINGVMLTCIMSWCITLLMAFTFSDAPIGNMEIHRYSDNKYWRAGIFPISIFYVITQNSKMTSWRLYFNTLEFNSIHLFLNTENIKWNAANACNKLVYCIVFPLLDFDFQFFQVKTLISRNF
jgi:hypothetical protein